MWLSWKAYLKQFRVVYIVNAFIKCGLMKCSLLVLRWKYKRLSKIKRYIYNENKAINEFKERCCRLRPYFTPSSNTRLRIFWVGACESQDESGFLQSLRRLGVVTVLYNREGGYGALDNSEVLGGKRVKMDELRRNNDEDLLRGFIQANNNGGVDVLIGQMWAHLFSVEALSKIRSAGVPVINISMDDRLPVHWGMRDGIRMGSIGLSSAVDIVLTTVYESCAWYGVEGCPAIYWPLASDPDLFLSEDDDVKDIDVLFIGNRYGVRGKIVRYLEKNGVKVECYGMAGQMDT